MIKQSIFEKRATDKFIHYEDRGASIGIGKKIISLLQQAHDRPIVVVCIGTDRSTGDSLGPLIGTMLEERALDRFHVFGTLDDPVHAVNLEEKLSFIETTYEQPYIISVDACLGRLKNVGSFQIEQGPLKPGAAVNKDLPPVGDMHITGVVNVSGFMEYLVLQNTRLSLVMKMAKTIANGIYYAHFLCNKTHKQAIPFKQPKSSYTMQANEN